MEEAYGNVFAVVADEVIAPAILSAPPNVLVPVVVNAPTIVDEACDTKPLVNVPRPVCVRAPRTLSEPSDAVCAKRLVELAVVEKRLVVVAFASVVLPVTPRVPATARLPAESMVVVAVPPKYALSKTESLVDDACVTRRRFVEVEKVKFVASCPSTVPSPMKRIEPVVPFVTSPFISVEPTFFQALPLYTLSLLSELSKTVRPAAAEPIAFFCAVVIRGGRKPLLVESIWNTADASTDDAPIPVVPATKRLPALSKVLVAEPPKYALLNTESLVVDA